MLKELFFISRPISLLAFIPIFYLGYLSSGQTWGNLTSILFIFITFPLSVIVFGLNDISDRISDQTNPHKNFWRGYPLKDVQIPLVIKTILIISLIPLLICLSFRNYPAALIILIMILLAYSYSFPPIRLKSIPFLDSLSNGVGFLLIYLLGYSHSQIGFTADLKVPIIGWLITLGASSAHMASTLWDLSQDQKAGDLTIGRLLKSRLTLIFVIILNLIIYILLPLPNIAVYLYLSAVIFCCLVMLINPTQRFINKGVWLILWLFPILSGYLLIFELGYVLEISSK